MSDVCTQFKSLFELHRSTLAWQPEANQLNKLTDLYDGICAGNQKLNLTRITTLEDFWEKHLWDSFVALNPIFSDLPNTGKLIDIGTGGGFPGLPLAIAYPEWQITLLDSTRKKIAFLNELSETLALNTVGIADRAEAVGQNPAYRAQFDLVTIRAVAKAAICVEYTLPLLKIDGLAILYRGQWSESETEKLIPAIAQCGGFLERTEQFITPLTQSQRTCLYIRKIEPTDQYLPRAIGVPKQSPLSDV
ncbi:16S rRNA m(7)G-527 methyltransferase [[Leptolyngbya] sp. PCC 7376]|uniref:16S rRNA (guanine(527)-N(7))-methyltransferase RsmG n=1 Tax=[Leptolyngbya] sp. PCC 7376 TaxID=111781 RepID=UPI00029F06FC|nr:16S rRNA (guanine(527)-N(7))-methyltransferase RsmG [[Leptolyngbya] sp. PCC 7376]AFY40157.1 16S rRNA m(7)G-527 methyltransferase [[Leptolyngbya] sp. PCC 7376]